jgi:hypothetical protein
MEHGASLDGADARKPPLATLCAAFDCAVATSPHKVADSVRCGWWRWTGNASN